MAEKDQGPKMEYMSESYLPKFLDAVASAFTDTALTTTFICEIDKIAPPYPVASVMSFDRRREYFTKGIVDAFHAGAIMVQAGDGSAVALWEPPGFKGVPFTDVKKNAGEVCDEWCSRIHTIKKKYLAAVVVQSSGPTDDSDEAAATAAIPAPVPQPPHLRPHWHLSFLARNLLPGVPRVPGAISAVIRPFLEKACEEGVPVWLEASGINARDVYLHYGFRVVEEVVCGVGKVTEDGWPQEGGPGASAWAMIYDAHLK